MIGAKLVSTEAMENEIVATEKKIDKLEAALVEERDKLSAKKRRLADMQSQQANDRNFIEMVLASYGKA